MKYTPVKLAAEDWRRIDELLSERPGARPFMHYTSAWARVLADTLGDQSAYVGAEDSSGELAGFIPAFLHRNDVGNHLSSLPIHNGFGGVFPACDCDEEALYGVLLGAAAELAAQENCVSATLVSHPLADRPALYKKYFQARFVFDRFTQTIDISPGFEYNQKKRNQLARIKEFGVDLKIHSVLEGEELEAFHRGQAASKTARGLNPKPLALFRAVNRHAGDMPRYVTAHYEGKTIAGLLLFFFGGVAEYYESWFDAACAHLHPISLCVDAGLQAAIREGMSLWNWEASPKRGDGVYEFKRKWSSVDTDYHFYTRTFASLERWRSMGREELARRYPWYFVMPYDAL